MKLISAAALLLSAHTVFGTGDFAVGDEIDKKRLSRFLVAGSTCDGTVFTSLCVSIYTYIVDVSPTDGLSFFCLHRTTPHHTL